MLVSVVLATYNGEKYIREQLDSILSQTISDFELVVCDDCSSDNTFSIICDYSKLDTRIKVFQNTKNLGFLKNFEKAFALCSGDYIACCDQDDVWTSNHLEILLNHIEKNDCVGANSILVDDNLKSLGRTHQQSLRIVSLPNTNKKLLEYECHFNMIQGSACLFKRELLKSILPFPEGIEFHDHWIALNASVQNGCKYIPDVILKYRIHSQNVTEHKTFQLNIFFQTKRKIAIHRSRIYTSRITMLQALLSKNQDTTNREILSKANNFILNLKNNNSRFKATAYFVMNYPSITLCPRTKWVLFLYRSLCVFFFGIML